MIKQTEAGFEEKGQQGDDATGVWVATYLLLRR
jgi:hypothetical protein